jgi:quinoprotein glucose dehydrogenase
MPLLASFISRAAEFASWPAGTAEIPGPRDALFRRMINANFRVGTAASAAALAQFASRSGAPESFRAEALTLLGEWAKPSGRDRMTGLWRPLAPRDPGIAAKALQPVLSALLRDGPNPIKIAAARVAAQLEIKTVAPDLYELATNPSQPVNVRIEALKALAALKDRKAPDAVKIALADSHESLRNEATKIQAQLRPKDATAQIRITLEKGSIKEKQTALTTLGTMSGPAADEILSQWLDKLIAKNVAPELQLDLLDVAAKRSSPAMKDKLRKFEASRDARDDLRAFRECLAGGDANEGRTVFMEKAEASRLRCHKVGNEGGEVGPNLAGLGTRQNREYILESIILPNKKIAPGFETLLVTLKDDTTYAGILKSETDMILEINSPEDGVLKLKKADIKTRARGLSSMPEELRQVLTKQDVRNLVEFLSTAK